MTSSHLRTLYSAEEICFERKDFSSPVGKAEKHYDIGKAKKIYRSNCAAKPSRKFQLIFIFKKNSLMSFKKNEFAALNAGLVRKTSPTSAKSVFTNEIVCNLPYLDVSLSTWVNDVFLWYTFSLSLRLPMDIQMYCLNAHGRLISFVESVPGSIILSFNLKAIIWLKN